MTTAANRPREGRRRSVGVKDSLHVPRRAGWNEGSPVEGVGRHPQGRRCAARGCLLGLDEEAEAAIRGQSGGVVPRVGEHGRAHGRERARPSVYAVYLRRDLSRRLVREAVEDEPSVGRGLRRRCLRQAVAAVYGRRKHAVGRESRLLVIGVRFGELFHAAFGGGGLRRTGGEEVGKGGVRSVLAAPLP